MAKSKNPAINARRSRFEQIVSSLNQEGTKQGIPVAQMGGFFPPHLSLANTKGGGLQVQFYHVATEKVAEFAAFVTSYNENFASNWNSQEVYGRMDPIMNFKNTTRTISLSLDVPSAHAIEAQSNLAELNCLTSMLYPTYEGNIMKGAPLVKVQFQNLIASSRQQSKLKAISIDAKTNGLFVAITSLNITPDFEQGTLQQKIVDKEGESAEGNNGILLPELWRVDMSLSVMHDHQLDSNQLGDMAFPFGGALQSKENPSAGDSKKEEDPPPSTKTSDANVNGNQIPGVKAKQTPPAAAPEDAASTTPPESKAATPGKTNVSFLGADVMQVDENTSISFLK